MKNNKYYNKINLLQKEIKKVFVGRDKIVHNLLIGFLSGLHVLIEDIPGVGKTTLAKTLSKCTGMDFARIQFTPDLLPGDILGMNIWSMEKKEFIFKPGAIMHQFILADEINRASSRTQSSFLEAMQECSVTIDGKTLQLPQPFFVIATQNPIDFTGTFHLPEAQLDRFGISFSIGYPDENDEETILTRFKENDPIKDIANVISPSEIIMIREEIHKIFVNDKIKKYAINIANNTRKSKKIKLGMSPRATLHLILASQAEAFLHERDYVIPEDILSSIEITLPHRLILTAAAKMENQHTQDLLREILSSINVPTGL